MASAIGDLVATLGMNVSPFQAGASRATAIATSMAEKIGSVAEKIKGSFGSLLAGGAAVAGLYESVRLAQDAAREQKRLGVILESTGTAARISAADIRQFADGLKEVSNFDDDAVVSAAAALAPFAKGMSGDTFKATLKAAADLTSVMGGDLGGNAQSLGMAMQAPERAMKLLRGYGIQFTDVQKEQLLLYQKAGNAAAVHGIILAQVNAKFAGDAEKMASPMTQLRNRLEDIGKAIGGVVLPYMNMLAKSTLPVAAAIAACTLAMASLAASVIGSGVAMIGRMVALAGAFLSVARAIGGMTIAMVGFNAAVNLSLIAAVVAAGVALRQYIMADAQAKLAAVEKQNRVSPLSSSQLAAINRLGVMNRVQDYAETPMGLAEQKALKEKQKAYERIDETIQKINNDAATMGATEGAKQLLEIKQALDKQAPVAWSGEERDIYAKAEEAANALGQAEAAKKIREMEDALQRASGPMGELTADMRKFSETPGVTQEQLARFKELWTQTKNAAGFKQASESIRTLAFEVYGLAQGWTEAQMAASKYAMTPGVTQSQIDQIAALSQQKENLEKGKALWESVMTPAEKYQKTLRENMRLLQSGAITEAVFMRGGRNAAQEYIQAAAPSDAAGPIEFGSDEAYREIYRLTDQSGTETLQQQMLANLKTIAEWTQANPNIAINDQQQSTDWQDW